MAGDQLWPRTHKQAVVFLADHGPAYGAQIGEAIAPERASSSRGYAMIGNSIARQCWPLVEVDPATKRERYIFRVTAAGMAAAEKFRTALATTQGRETGGGVDG